tara:strand:+ start:1378 stop:2241 length:864 start_codon:yes stop_codon:yes gene_type:complete
MSKKINLSTLANLISIIKLKDEWKINNLSDKANINNDELFYLLNVLSQIYSINGEYFFDFELDTTNNKVIFNNANDIFDFETITDLELFKIYTLINDIDIDLTFENISKNDFNKFNKILKDSFKLFDFEVSNEKSNKNIILNRITKINYVKLGTNKSEIYEIEPLLITSNIDGSILEAYDLKDKKVKTFLINRIISVDKNKDSLLKTKKVTREIEVKFKLNDEKLLKKLNNYKYKKNDNNYIAKFRNKNIAVEFFIENFNTAKVISPDVVKVDVMNRIKSINKLLSL